MYRLVHHRLSGHMVSPPNILNAQGNPKLEKINNLS